MLTKDYILIKKLEHTTKNISINIELNFMLNNINTTFLCQYIPDKFKIEQESILNYLNELTKSAEFNLEELSAKTLEDLYDIAVPKYISITLSNKNNDIKTSITGHKNQPNFKL